MWKKAISFKTRVVFFFLFFTIDALRNKYGDDKYKIIMYKHILLT